MISYRLRLFQVTQIQSEQFTSHVYVLTTSFSDEVFLIDCGGFQPVLDFLGAEAKVKGIFLTHYHYDHIYYLQHWFAMFPDLIVYGSEKTIFGLSNAKVNLSYYHGDSVEVSINNVVCLEDQSKIELLEGAFIKSFSTEGHCEGSLSFQLGNYFFTGDSLIPNIPTVTKLRTGSKDKARDSIVKIHKLVEKSSIICPGHLAMVSVDDVDWHLYLSHSSNYF